MPCPDFFAHAFANFARFWCVVSGNTDSTDASARGNLRSTDKLVPAPTPANAN